MGASHIRPLPFHCIIRTVTTTRRIRNPHRGVYSRGLPTSLTRHIHARLGPPASQCGVHARGARTRPSQIPVLELSPPTHLAVGCCTGQLILVRRTDIGSSRYGAPSSYGVCVGRHGLTSQTSRASRLVLLFPFFSFFFFCPSTASFAPPAPHIDTPRISRDQIVTAPAHSYPAHRARTKKPTRVRLADDMRGVCSRGRCQWLPHLAHMA